VLIRASRRWNKIPMSERELTRIQELRIKFGIVDEERKEIQSAS